MHEDSNILQNSPEGLQRCAHLLQEDRLVAVPTETVYGLAGNALSEKAVRKIFTVKGRPLIDPLISHFSNTSAVFEHVYSSPEALELANMFWPGPLTLVLPKRQSIPDLVTAGLESAAVRVPRHPALQALLHQVDFPLAAPSANPFGYVSPTKAEHVATTLGPSISAILDGGPCRHGLESTVLDLREPQNPKMLRPGPIESREIEEVLGLKVNKDSPAGCDSAAQTSPGQLSKHYSPKAAIEIIKNGTQGYVPNSGEALILNSRPNSRPSRHQTNQIYWLSENGDVDVIARNFFDLLQRLDQRDFEKLVIEAAPEKGIGLAINDRLRRAAAR